MVEGGPSAALDFLEEIMFDRGIIIRSPITFQKTLGSGMSGDMAVRLFLIGSVFIHPVENNNF